MKPLRLELTAIARFISFNREAQVERKNEKPADIAGLRQSFAFSKRSGAGEGARTLDPDLGKVVLYH